MMEGEIRAGVAGAGVFGGYHAQKYAAAEGVRLAAIFDPVPEKAQALAEAHGAQAFTGYADFLHAVDVLTVATPAPFHAELAGRAMERGRHVLIEKPVAMTVEAADTLIFMAEEAGLILQVGHQERYVAEALGLLDRPERPQRFAARRLNRFSPRALDVSVVMDLMIHDLDLLAKLAGTDEAEIATCEARAEHGENADHVEARLRFASGLEAQLSASRLAREPVRDLALHYPDGRLHLDFLSREVTNETGTPLKASLGGGGSLALEDPLGYGTRSFLDAVRGGAMRGVGGAEGRAALKLATIIEQAAKEVL
ncbi:Gfo/Idh/MocA family protein [Parvularcula oceani]|uniref:Gfo/Idh/MocA family protein n=1 Tax=Parvularcula oceani TaxID=1247963 RepID=UPI0009DD1812|nr:Gfo/Idh/MocA family oxidoreductase [Parvularcula oceani]